MKIVFPQKCLPTYNKILQLELTTWKTYMNYVKFKTPSSELHITRISELLIA